MWSHKWSQTSQSLLWIKIWCTVFFSLLLSSDRYLMTLLRNHFDCCFVMSHHVTLQGRHLVIPLQLLFATFNSPWTLHCDVSKNSVRIKSHYFYLIWRTLGNFTVELPHGIICDYEIILYNFGTVRKNIIMIILQLWLQIIVIGESLY